MNKGNLIGIDLSKHSFQGCLLNGQDSEVFNRHFTHKRLVDWLSQQQPLTVAFEACGTAHHWGPVGSAHGSPGCVDTPSSGYTLSAGP